MNKKKKMKVFTKKPTGGTVLNVPEGYTEDQRKTFTYMKSEGDFDYVCGSCEHVLLASMRPDQVQRIAFECPICGVYNQPV